MCNNNLLLCTLHNKLDRLLGAWSDQEGGLVILGAEGEICYAPLATVFMQSPNTSPLRTFFLIVPLFSSRFKSTNVN